jgi:site-specific DNA-methyltransferase (adenine-specific)
MYRVLQDESFCISFYGWNKADLFMGAWRAAGLRMVGHIVFRKAYASSVRFMRYQHEQAYLLAKGDVIPPRDPLSNVMDFPYGARRTAGADRRAPIGKYGTGARSAGKQLRRVGDLWA